MCGEDYLGGRTIVLLGSTFSLELTSDGSVEYFGFCITKVEALTGKEYRACGEYTYETLDNGTLEIISHYDSETASFQMSKSEKERFLCCFHRSVKSSFSIAKPAISPLAPSGITGSRSTISSAFWNKSIHACRI